MTRTPVTSRRRKELDIILNSMVRVFNVVFMTWFRLSLLRIHITRPLMKSEEQKRHKRAIWLFRLIKESDIVCISQLRMDRRTFSILCEMVSEIGGALDGTSISVAPPSDQKPRYRTRKGNIATNMLGVCYPNMQFIYVLPGWEGSAHDEHVLRDAISRVDGLKIPQGCYYLVDAGYCNAPGFLAPFRGQRYHLNEFHGHRPQTAEEFFNMKHSKARNVIERCFGLLKGKYMSFDPLELEQVEEDETEDEEQFEEELEQVEEDETEDEEQFEDEGEVVMVLRLCSLAMVCYFVLSAKSRVGRYMCVNPTFSMFKRLYKCQYGSLRILFDPRKSLGYKPTHCNLGYLKERPVLTQVQLPRLHSKSYGDVKMFESGESLLLICWDYEHPKHLGVYEMRNGFTDWRFKYFVDLKDVLRAFGETHWGIRPSVMCLFLGEREEDSFMLLELDEKLGGSWMDSRYCYSDIVWLISRTPQVPLWETCVAIDEWVEYPMAHTALDDGNATSQENLPGSKDVTAQLVGMVNNIINNVCNLNPQPFPFQSYFRYNQSGPLVSTLCNSLYANKTVQMCQVEAGKLELNNATTSSYEVNANDAYTYVGLTPNMNQQMSAAVN
nr:hypothetical protein [Tanacetum cinerariifolium]